jgi:hypothetical protein
VAGGFLDVPCTVPEELVPFIPQLNDDPTAFGNLLASFASTILNGVSGFGLTEQFAYGDVTVFLPTEGPSSSGFDIPTPSSGNATQSAPTTSAAATPTATPTGVPKQTPTPTQMPLA